jgi:hypothetical protein
MATVTIDGQILLTHILSRVEGDLSFLQSQNILSEHAYREIVSLLPQRSGQTVQLRAAQPNVPLLEPMIIMPVASSTPTPPPSNGVMPALKRAVPPPPKPKPSKPVVVARALWDYNLDEAVSFIASRHFKLSF